MSLDPQESLSESELESLPDTASVPDTSTLPIERLLRDICRDAKTDPESYLEQTVVPYGGE